MINSLIVPMTVILCCRFVVRNFKSTETAFSENKIKNPKKNPRKYGEWIDSRY